MKNVKKNIRLKKICLEDRKKLEVSTQRIVDEFNCVDTYLHYADGDREKVLINGLAVYGEAAADNFSLNFVTALAKEENQDLLPIFFTFARFFYGTYSLQDFTLDKYPPAPYRVNIGLKLCNNFN